MSQPTIYEQIRELKGMIYDNQRMSKALFADLQKRIELLENGRQADQVLVLSCSNYLQHIDKMYAESLGKISQLTPEPSADSTSTVYSVRELYELMKVKFGNNVKREDYYFPLLRNDYIGYSICSDGSKTYYPLKTGADAGVIMDGKPLRFTQKGVSEMVSYMVSKGWKVVQ